MGNRRRKKSGGGCSLSVNPQEVSEGRSPLTLLPNPATCAVGSEGLHSKASLRVSPAAPLAQKKPVLAEKIASASFFAGLKPPPEKIRRRLFVCMKRM